MSIDDMPPMQRTFTAQERGKLKVAVALIPALGVTHVRPLTGTTCASLKPAKQYYTKASKGNKIATSMTQAEYMDFAAEVLELLKEKGCKVIWVHDRDRAHLGEAATQQIQDQGHKVMVLPPRSPDLDPLDYAVFGHSKLWLERNEGVRKLVWDDKCSAFIDHIKRLDPGRQMAGLKKRLEMVIQENGGHIEHKIRG